MIEAASGVPEQGAVDDRDTLLHGVRDLLSIYSSKKKSELIGFMGKKSQR